MNTRNIQVTIEGRNQVVKLSIENDGPKSDHYYLSAKCESGFDLCNLHYGYYKAYVPKTRKLRSEKSINLDMERTLDAFELAIIRDANTFLLTAIDVTVKISGPQFYSSNSNIRFGEVCNIYSKQSGKPIAWYPHDVYNEGELIVTAYRATSGQIKLEADESKLYNQSKVRALVESKEFKSGNFAFFFYEEAKRLAGLKHGNTNSMSGLFK